MTVRPFAEKIAISLEKPDPNRLPHSWPTLNHDEWWACTRPESLPDDGIWWDEVCPRCCLAYELHRRTHPYFAVWHKGALVAMSTVAMEDVRDGEFDG